MDETIGSALLQLIAQQGVAVALIFGLFWLSVWAMRFYFTSVWPANNERAMREIELKARDAEVTGYLATSLGHFTDVVRDLHEHQQEANRVLARLRTLPPNPD